MSETRDRRLALVLRLCLEATAFLLPLVFFLDANEVFELGKSVALRVLTSAAVICWALRGGRLNSRTVPATLLFLGMGVLSQTAAPLRLAGAERLWELASVVVLLWLAESGAVGLPRLLAAALWSNTLVTVYGLVQYLGFDMIQWTSFGDNRVYATLGNPDFLAAQSSLLLPLEICLIAALTATPPQRWWADLVARFRSADGGTPGEAATDLGWQAARGMLLAGGATFGVLGLGTTVVAFTFRNERAGGAVSLFSVVNRIHQFNPDHPDAPLYLFLLGGASLLLVILATVVRVRRTDARNLVLAAFLLGLPSLFYTQARGAYLGFVAALHAIIWFADRHVFRHSRWQTLGRMAAIDLGLAAVLLITPPGHRLVGRFMDIARDPVQASDLQIRLFYWYSAWQMGIHNPVTGAGLGNYHIAGAKSQGLSQVIWDKKWPHAAEAVSPHLELYAHNDYAHLFAEIGPTGLGLYLWIMVAVLAFGLAGLGRLPEDDARRRWVLIGLLAAAVSYYVNSLFNFPLKVTANAHLFYAVVVPFLIAFAPVARRERVVAKAGWIVTVICLVALALAERAAGTLVATYYLKFGHQYTESNYPVAGLGWFDKADRMRPVHTDGIVTHYYAGRAWQMAGDLDASIREYTRAIDIFTNFPEARRDRGNAKEEMAERIGQTSPAVAATLMADALADFESARVLNPKDPRTLFSIGRTHIVQGDPADSLEPFALAIKYSRVNATTYAPPAADAAYGMAMAYWQMHRKAEAKAAAMQALTYEPNHPGARGLLAAMAAGRSIPVPKPIGVAPASGSPAKPATPAKPGRPSSPASPTAPATTASPAGHSSDELNVP